MSSALRRISQLPKSIKFLRAVGADTTENIVTDASMEYFLLNYVVSNIDSLTGVFTTVLSDLTPDLSEYTTVGLVRDMGRRVYIKSAINTANPLRQVWVQVQAVNGADSEGVPPDYDSAGSFWVCTWADSRDEVNVKWARTG